MPRPDFKKKENLSASRWYDLYEDWDLIDATFASQYGIRLRADTEMTWGEFSTLLSGIMPETPLGQIVSIRSETDKDMLKNFTSEQRKIRQDWLSREAKRMVDNGNAEEMVKQFQEACKRAFAAGGDTRGR